MDNEISALIDRLRQIETEIEQRLAERSEALRHDLKNSKVIFERSVLEEHRRL